MITSRLALAAALSLSVGAPAAAQPASQTIIAWSFGFAPRPIVLAAGQPVTLTFTNRSGSSHDFKAPAFFGRSTILSSDAREGEIDLAPYQTKTVRLIPRAGIYTAHCSHFFHAQLGMTDTIVVR